jgi:hypothetical protein
MGIVMRSRSWIAAIILAATTAVSAKIDIENSESAARAALTNDFDNVLKLHFAHGINHAVNE